jgi:4-amino-4-deoxy-L-arabinose transferase-like glycosyltransferase
MTSLLTTNPTRAAIAVILGALALRLALALVIGLGTDEIYTVAVARQLSLSYFDHPPLHQWITHASTLMLGEGRQTRAPFILLFAGTSWLLFLITRRLFGASAGLWAVAALNLSAFFTLSAGSWIVPDGALLFFLALAVWALARQLFPLDHETPRPWLHWLIAGAALGLSGLSKYHGVLVALGAALFLVGTARRRKALTHPAPWAGAALAALIISPVLIWNARHGWASFLFQAGRSQGEGVAPWLAPLSLLAQAGWLLPWVFAWLAMGLWAAWRSARDERFWFLASLGLPTIALFTLLPIFGNLGLPHWAMPGWFLLMPLAGLWLAGLTDQTRPQRWARQAAIGTLAVLALIGSHAATGWMTRLVPAISRSDPTLETVGWDQLRARLRETGLDDPRRVIITDSWQNAGRADVALERSYTVMPGTLDPRHYAFIIDQRTLLGRDGLLVVRARREAQMRETLRGHFASLGESRRITLGRAGLPEIELVVIPAGGFAKPLPWAYGIRP